MKTIEWHGAKILSKIKKEARRAEKEVAEDVAATARKLVPVGEYEVSPGAGGKWWKKRYPGLLRDSITVKPSKFRGGGYIVFVPGQGSATYYVRWVELGAPARKNQQWRTGGHKFPVPRQPFLRPAYEQHENDLFISLKSGVFRKLK